MVGANTLTVEDVLKIGDIFIGEPLFELETDTVAGRLSKDVRIEDVSVRRVLPSAIEVKIRERQPVATIGCNYGYLDIDRTGKVIDIYKTLKTMPVPMITGTTINDRYIGDDIDDGVIKKLLVYLQKLDIASLNKLSEISVADDNYIVAYTATDHPVQIRLGKMERIDEKVKLTDNFLKDLDKNPNLVEYIDFNYTAPVIKFVAR